MNVLRLKTGEKVAIDQATTDMIETCMIQGREFIRAAYNVMFNRDNFQSIVPMAK